METIATRGDFRVTFNGSNTYFVIDNVDQCWKYYTSKSAAIKYMNKVAEMSGQ